MIRSRPVLFVLSLVVLSLPVWAESSAADVVFIHGNVILMTSPEDIHEALAIAGNRILQAGTTADILALSDETTIRIDLMGRTIIPGFIDPHTHLLNDSWRQGLSPIEAQTLALMNGITSAANLYTTPDLTLEYIDLAESDQMRVRMSLYLIYNTSCGDVLGTWYSAYKPLTKIGPRLRIGGVKIFSETSVCDGNRIGISFTESLQSKLSPAGQEWYGSNRPLFTSEELAEIVREAEEHGFPVAIHAIGDGGVQVSLNAITTALDGGPNDLRHTILHNLFVRDDLLPLYAEVGIVAAVESMTSCFASFYRDLLRLEDKSIVRRWQDLVETGAHVAADSDWPWSAEEGINPLFRLQALIVPDNRSVSYGDWEPCGLLPKDQLLTAWQGLRMMTVEAAYMLHRDHELGTLEAGKLADLVILSDNPLTVHPDALTDIEVLLTMVDGIVEWRSADF